MRAYGVNKTGSKAQGLCEIHGGFVPKAESTSLLILMHDNGAHTYVWGCRSCWMALARAAGPVAEVTTESSK